MASEKLLPTTPAAFEVQKHLPVTPILTKYRPKTYSEVIGQTAAIGRLITGGLARHRAFLFTGMRGVGKTTLARIVAKDTGATPGRVIEVDAASHGGVEAVRALLQHVCPPLLLSTAISLIIDECQFLSKEAWAAMLKPLEEPPDYVRIIIITTEPERVPVTVKSRCFPVTLNPVAPDILIPYVSQIADYEAFKVSHESIVRIVEASGGSVREALLYLSLVAAGADPESLFPDNY